MAIARFKDLVLDAVDARRLGEFWAQALHLDWHAEENGSDGWLSGPTPQHTIWINQVPEPLDVKNRVHVDMYAESIADLEALGATVVQQYPRWTTMADPEGTLFCAFLREQVPADRVHGIVIDSAEPETIAAWWAGVFDAPLDLHEDRPEHDWGTVEKVPGMPILTMDFNLVPEPKTVKNRLHWDVTVADLQALLGAGATLLRPRDSEIRWHVLADPAGNEFCAFEDNHEAANAPTGAA